MWFGFLFSLRFWVATWIVILFIGLVWHQKPLAKRNIVPYKTEECSV